MFRLLPTLVEAMRVVIYSLKMVCQSKTLFSDPDQGNTPTYYPAKNAALATAVGQFYTTGEVGIHCRTICLQLFCELQELLLLDGF
jgi:hypothetical protein